jgi:hypothetical protein
VSCPVMNSYACPSNAVPPALNISPCFWSSSGHLFLFQHSAHSFFLGDTFFQKKIFSKSRFVVTVGLQNATRYAIAEAFAKFAFSIVSAKRDALRDASSICNTRIACVALMGRAYASLSSSSLSYSSPKESRTRKMMSQFLRTILLPTVQHLHDSGKSIPDYPSPPSSVPPFPKGWCFFVFL